MIKILANYEPVFMSMVQIFTCMPKYCSVIKIMTMLILTILTNFLCNNRESVDVGKLSRNIEIVAEALARYVYNVSSHGNLQLFSGGLVRGFTLYSALTF